jgi:hypothetical protein
LIEVQQYQESYYDILKAMLESQNYKDEVLPDSLPKIGFIASDSATHIAVGFLRLMEGNIAQIDSLVSNADLPSEMRHKGISMVVDELIKTSKLLKLKGIMALTVDKSVIMRAEAIGFQVRSHTILSLPLGDIK